MEKSKKHILVVSQYYNPEPHRIDDICAELVKRGYKITVVTGIPNYPEGKFYPGYSWFKRRKETVNGVDVIRIPLFPRGKSFIGLAANYLSFAFFGFFWQLFTKVKADVVFGFGLSPIFQVLPGIWYARRKKIPMYVYVQDLWPESFEEVTGIHHPLLVKPLSKLVTYIYDRCDRILGTSPRFVEEIGKRVTGNREKISYWPQYAEDFYVPAERKPVPEIPEDGSFKVVFTGNVGQAQGLDILPPVAKLLKQKGMDKVRFVIVGNGRYKEQLAQDIENAGVADMFTLVDRQPAQRIPELLAACDAAFLSLRGNLLEKTIPAKLQSYMACGMPVIGAVDGEAANVIREAGCGVYCPAEDAQALADAVIRLMEDPDIQTMGHNARTYYNEHFDKKMLMDKLEEMLFSR